MGPTRLARVEAALRVVLAFIEAVNRHDLDAMLQLVSEDCRFESGAPPPDGAVSSGRGAFSRFWQDLFQSLPDVRIAVEEISSAGLRCVVCARYEWRDLAGDRHHLRAADLYRVEGGSIREVLSYVKGPPLLPGARAAAKV